MRLGKIIGCCLIASFALSAVLGASASGYMLWRPNKYVTHYLSSGPTPFYEASEEGDIGCENVIDTGVGSAWRFADATVMRFQGCTLGSNSAHCTSVGAEAGEIVTAKLGGKIGFLSGKSGAAGLELRPEGKEGAFASFKCGEVSAEIRGGVIGRITPTNAIVNPEEHFVIAYEQSGGKQAYSQLEGGPVDQLEISFNKGTFTPSPVEFDDGLFPSGPQEIITNPPEFYECHKVLKGTGEFTDKKCSVPGKGSYALASGIGKGKPFKGSGTSATLLTPAVGGNVTCAKGKSSGLINGPNTVSGVVIAFSKCVTVGKACTSPGAKKGEIRTSTLEGALGYIERPSRVGLTLLAAEGVPYARFNCEGIEAVTEGAVISEIKGDVNAFSRTSTQVYAVTEAGVQSPTSFEAAPQETLFSTINGSGPFPSAVQGTITIKGEELEIKA